MGSQQNAAKRGFVATKITARLDNPRRLRQISGVRAHGMWTYEPRQGRKAATVVCSVSAVVTLTLFQFKMKNVKLKMPDTQAANLSPAVPRFLILHF
jgi:hypothetical protein